MIGLCKGKSHRLFNSVQSAAVVVRAITTTVLAGERSRVFITLLIPPRPNQFQATNVKPEGSRILPGALTGLWLRTLKFRGFARKPLPSSYMSTTSTITILPTDYLSATITNCSSLLCEKSSGSEVIFSSAPTSVMRCSDSFVQSQQDIMEAQNLAEGQSSGAAGGALSGAILVGPPPRACSNF